MYTLWLPCVPEEEYTLGHCLAYAAVHVG